MRKAVIFTVLFFVVWASTIYATPGDTLWTHTYGDSLNEFIISAQPTSDGGYVAAGYTYSYGSGLRDVYVIKVDSQGDTMWTRAYGG
ncbi:MAG: hypothetical protein GY855_05665, partial [candidate division Zixibacteria bacterium]|nr:hypothetical protein [candidate division Zixibacteria bacterium]